LIPSEVCVRDIHGIVGTSSESLALASVNEFEEERKETSKVDQLNASEYPKKVSCIL
jgi:hypothetical protein